MAEGTARIGRIGVPANKGGDGDTLLEPHTITQTDDTLRLAGTAQEANIAITQWRRDQFLGLSPAYTGGEPVIPVYLSSFTYLNGWYRVLSVTADRATSRLEWSIELQRSADWANSKVEVHTMASVLTNSHSITAGAAVFAPPGGYIAHDHGFALGGGIIGSLPNGDGFTQDQMATPEEPAAVFATWSPWTQTFHVLPENWYLGGCRVEHDLLDDDSPSTYRTVVGRRSFGNENANSARIRLSNGLVRLGTATGNLATWWWDGSNWVGPYAFFLNSNAGTTHVPRNSVSVVHNSPELCTIRFAVVTDPGAGVWSGSSPGYVDFTIRRGSRIVYGYAASTVPVQWRIGFNSITASTAVAGGIRRTANNAEGHREIFFTNNATTNDLANGRITQTSTTVGPMVFGIGIEAGGSSSVYPYDAVGNSEEFFGAVSEAPTVVSV